MSAFAFSHCFKPILSLFDVWKASQLVKIHNIFHFREMPFPFQASTSLVVVLSCPQKERKTPKKQTNKSNATHHPLILFLSS